MRGLSLSRLPRPFGRGVPALDTAEPITPAPGEPQPRRYRVRATGSVSRRMILIATAWIMILLVGGGYALDRVLTTAITRNFDEQLDYLLNSMIVSAELDSNGEVAFN